MAGKNSIQLLRSTTQALINTHHSTTILPGQPLYDMTAHKLFIGGDDVNTYSSLYDYAIGNHLLVEDNEWNGNNFFNKPLRIRADFDVMFYAEVFDTPSTESKLNLCNSTIIIGNSASHARLESTGLTVQGNLGMPIHYASNSITFPYYDSATMQMPASYTLSFPNRGGIIAVREDFTYDNGVLTINF